MQSILKYTWMLISFVFNQTSIVSCSLLFLNFGRTVGYIYPGQELNIEKKRGANFVSYESRNSNIDFQFERREKPQTLQGHQGK